MLRPTDAGIDAAKSPGTNPIILNGTWKKKNFTYKMSKLQELDPQFYQ
jgi:hypothetical protein